MMLKTMVAAREIPIIAQAMTSSVSDIRDEKRERRASQARGNARKNGTPRRERGQSEPYPSDNGLTTTFQGEVLSANSRKTMAMAGIEMSSAITRIATGGCEGESAEGCAYARIGAWSGDIAKCWRMLSYYSIRLFRTTEVPAMSVTREAI